MPILQISNATKDYTSDGVSVRALDGVTLAAERGEFIALVGRSGCGKSTLLNMAGAMDLPTTGEVVIDGRSTSSLDDASLTSLRRTHVGFVFQSFQLLPSLSVLENVELPLLLAGAARSQGAALESLSLVEMDSFANRMPYQLSGGQAQRVAIARAIVHKPRILLADEPTGNLDSSTGELILRLLQRVASESGTAILMATHSVEAASGSDRLVSMRDGRIIHVEQPARAAR